MKPPIHFYFATLHHEDSPLPTIIQLYLNIFKKFKQTKTMRIHFIHFSSFLNTKVYLKSVCYLLINPTTRRKSNMFNLIIIEVNYFFILIPFSRTFSVFEVYFLFCYYIRKVQWYLKFLKALRIIFYLFLFPCLCFDF